MSRLGDSGLCDVLRREFCCFDFPADSEPAWAQAASLSLGRKLKAFLESLVYVWGLGPSQRLGQSLHKACGALLL